MISFLSKRSLGLWDKIEKVRIFMSGLLLGRFEISISGFDFVTTDTSKGFSQPFGFDVLNLHFVDLLFE